MLKRHSRVRKRLHVNSKHQRASAPGGRKPRSQREGRDHKPAPSYHSEVTLNPEPVTLMCKPLTLNLNPNCRAWKVQSSGRDFLPGSRGSRGRENPERIAKLGYFRSQLVHSASKLFFSLCKRKSKIAGGHLTSTCVGGLAEWLLARVGWGVHRPRRAAFFTSTGSC
jgi:hypothetical protein